MKTQLNTQTPAHTIWEPLSKEGYTALIVSTTIVALIALAFCVIGILNCSHVLNHLTKTASMIWIGVGVLAPLTIVTAYCAQKRILIPNMHRLQRDDRADESLTPIGRLLHKLGYKDAKVYYETTQDRGIETSKDIVCLGDDQVIAERQFRFEDIGICGADPERRIPLNDVSFANKIEIKIIEFHYKINIASLFEGLNPSEGEYEDVMSPDDPRLKIQSDEVTKRTQQFIEKIGLRASIFRANGWYSIKIDDHEYSIAAVSKRHGHPSIGPRAWHKTSEMERLYDCITKIVEIIN